MGSTCSYRLAILASPDEAADLDVEYVTHKLRKACSEAKVFLDEQGHPTGNEGPWSSIEADMAAFSKTMPTLTFHIEETIDYEQTEYTRYRFRDGRVASISPIVVWPDFDDGMYRQI